MQQRNGRKSLTTIQGIPKEVDSKRLLKAFKKVETIIQEFACNGTIVKDEEMGEVIQMSGDQRQKAGQFMIEQGIAPKDKIKIHGF
jgi:translation initiation factor 1